MRKAIMMWSVLLTFGTLCACSSDTDVVGMGNDGDHEMWSSENYDSTYYQVKYYHQYPDLNVKQGYWTQDGFIELFPQNAPPYNLLVKWSDELGKKAIDYILEKNPDVMTKEAYSEISNEYIITSNLYFESPYFYVSSYYKSSDMPTLDRYSIVVLPQIILTMKEGKSVESIMKDYADVLTLNNAIEDWGIYTFDCNLNTSQELLELNAEIYQRDDVEYSDFNTVGEYY